MNYDINMIVGYRLKPLTEAELRSRASKRDFPKILTRFEIANKTGGKHRSPYL